MKKHKHSAMDHPDTQPPHNEVAKSAYAIYQQEGRPQGHAMQNCVGGNGAP